MEVNILMMSGSNFLFFARALKVTFRIVVTLDSGWHVHGFQVEQVGGSTNQLRRASGSANLIQPAGLKSGDRGSTGENNLGDFRFFS